MSLGSAANTLCNDIDLQMIMYSESTSGQPCIINNTGDDPYTQMYRLNEAFKLVAQARALLRDCNQLNVPATEEQT